MSYLPLSSCAWLARLLNCVEAGAPWPAPLAHARCAYVCKVPVPSTDPLSYRGLLVLPVLYRTWAKARLFQLRSW
eukprot:8877290-Alexandrium_andersonii.AAC.1